MGRSVVYAAILTAGVALEPLLLNLGQRWAPTSGVMRAGGARTVETAALFTTLLQIIVVVVMARLLGRALSRFGQPAVIGEIAAGVVLGPSLLGRLAPAAFAALFPASSIPNLVALSQVGLILFMFVVGLEFAPVSSASR